MTEYSHRSEGDLRELYINKGMTQKEIAEITGVTDGTISTWMDKFNIDTGYKEHTQIEYSDLIQIYDQNKPFSEMASETDFTEDQVRHACIREGIHEPADQARYTDEELIQQIESIYNKNGKISKRLFESVEWAAHISTIESHFGNWKSALQLADIELEESQRNSMKTYDRQTILSEFQKYATEAEQVSLTDFLESEYGPSADIKPHYDSFSDLITDADIPTNKISSHWIEKEDIIEQTSNIDGPSTTTEIANSIGISREKLISEFGNEQSVFEECDIEKGDAGYSVEDVKQKLNDVSSNGVIKPKDIEECDVSYTTIRNKTPHQKISDAISYFGYEYDNRQYTDEELISEMKRCHKKHGDVKVGLFKQDNSLPSWMVYVQRFGSWSEAKQEAGFEPGQGRKKEYEQYTYLYGPKFLNKRQEVRERAGLECQVCGIDQSELDRKLDVHHIKPVNQHEDPSDAHTFDNLVAVCKGCHMSVEADKIDCPQPPVQK